MGKRHPARKGGGGPAFVQLYRWLLDTPAWRDLDPVARALYVEIKRHYTGTDNGTVGLGARDAGKALGVHYSTAARAFDRLREHGFIIAASPGRFGNGYHLSTEWLLTEARDDRNAAVATKDFVSWRPVAPAQPEIRSQVANRGTQVAPAQLSGSGLPQTVALAQLKGAVSQVHRLHQRNTLTSSHRHGAAQAGVVAPVHTGRVNEDGQASGPIAIGEALASSSLIENLRKKAGGRK